MSQVSAKGFMSAPCSSYPACRRYAFRDQESGKLVTGCRNPECPLVRKVYIKKAKRVVAETLGKRFAGLDL